MKEPSIIRGVLSYSVSTWANLLIGFLSIIISTRVMSPETYGLVGLFLSASNVLLYSFTLGMDGAYVRFFNEPPKGDSVQQMLYKSILVATIITITVGVIATFILGGFLSVKIFGVCSRLLIGMLFLEAYSLIVLRYLNITYRMSFQAKKYTIQNVLMSSLVRALMICAALVADDFHFIIVVMTLGIFLTLIAYLVVQKKDIVPVTINGNKDYSINLSNYKGYFRYSIFNMPAYVIDSVNLYLAQQIINTNISAHALGIFASTGMFASILMGIRGGFSTYWSAFVFKNYNEERYRISKMHNYVLLASIVLASLMVVFRDVIYLFIGSDFHESKQFFSLLLVLPFVYFVCETTDKGIYIAKKNEWSFINFSILVVINLGLCLMLTPRFGLMGAAYASAISAIVLYILNTHIGQKYYNNILNKKKSSAGFLLLILLLWFPSYDTEILHIVLFTLFINIIAFVLFKNEYKDLFSYSLYHIKRYKDNDKY